MKSDILIIGAGMAGLSAGRLFRENGLSVRILDKGRGVGGRVSTRRLGSESPPAGRWDHGAQFVTLRSDALCGILHRWGALQSLQDWHHAKEGLSRRRPMDGMNAFAKDLAGDLPIHNSQKAVKLIQNGISWDVHCESGDVFSAPLLLCTQPAPQLLDLLLASNLHLESADELRKIEYDSNLTLLAELDGPSGLEPPGFLRPPSAILHTVVDNQLKGISASPTITALSTPSFAREWYERDRSTAASVLRAALQEILSAKITAVQIHGWKFAEAIKRHPEPCLKLAEGLWAAGDGFTPDAHHPRIESALLSGIEAAKRLRLGV